MSPRLSFAIDAAYRAGRFTLQYFQTGAEVETKSDETPVTAADKGAERVIREMLSQRYPSEAILGEEEGGSSARDRWVIDPIDGTKSFVSGVPLYATLLSYEVDGEAVLGVCYFPALDEMLYAEKGAGAFFNGRPAKVSDKRDVKGSVLACGGLNSMKKRGRTNGFEKISDVALATRTWSDAYGHALVATGRIEAMVDPIVNPWDISALSLIVREAGGQFTDFAGNSELSDEAISSNGHVHAKVMEVFQG